MDQKILGFLKQAGNIKNCLDNNFEDFKASWNDRRPYCTMTGFAVLHLWLHKHHHTLFMLQIFSLMDRMHRVT